MSDWLKGFRQWIEKKKEALWSPSRSWTHGWLDPKQTPEQFEGRQLDARKDYVEIRLRSMRIPFKRIGTKKYYGAVHSFISLSSVSDIGKASFNVITTPTSLQKVDPKNVSNVIQEDIPLLGPVPYQGGDIEVEAGVFSILENDLITPFLKVAEDISKTASIDVVSQAIPFVQPLQNAIYSLVGASDSNKLEIGLKMSLKREGYLVVVGDGRTGDLSTLKLHKDGRLYTGTEEIAKCPYMVLTIKALKNRRTITTIPDLLKATNNLLAALRTWKEETILEFYNAFEKVAFSSPDLLPDDAKIITEQTYEERVKPVLDQIRGRGKGKGKVLGITAKADVKETMKLLNQIDISLKKRAR